MRETEPAIRRTQSRKPDGEGSYFDFERLDVFLRSLDILEEVRRICADPVRGNADLYDQLRRSAVSITLNIAEASGEFSPGDKVRIFRISRRSAHEAAATLHALRVMAHVDTHATARCMELLQRVSAMLLGLIRVWDARKAARL